MDKPLIQPTTFDCGSHTAPFTSQPARSATQAPNSKASGSPNFIRLIASREGKG